MVGYKDSVGFFQNILTFFLVITTSHLPPFPSSEYGPAVIEHVLLLVGFPAGVKINKGIDPNSEEDIKKLEDALQQAEHMIDRALQERSQVSSRNPKIV